MTTSYLHERGGWTTMSLTEDFEIQVEATMEGRRILWNHVARVYDEKPTSMRASIRQKIRWGQGHWFVALTNTGRLFRLAFQGKISAGEFISLLTYMYSLSAYLLVLVQAVATLALWAVTPDMQLFSFSFTGLLSGAVIFIYSYLFLFYLADWMDNRIAFSLRTIPVMVGGFFENTIVGIFNQLVGLIRCRDQQHWVKTEHEIRANTMQPLEHSHPAKAKAA